MLTVDCRCTDKTCKGEGIYRQVGACANCGQGRILMLFTAGHGISKGTCPRCQCDAVVAERQATDDEVPTAP